MTAPVKQKRPLSPHLQVYKPQLTSMLSILHRLTGMALSLGAFLLVGYLYCLTESEATRGCLFSVTQGPFFKIISFLWLFALCFHLLNGVRHLAWDMGYGLEIKQVYISGYSVLILSILFTFFLYGDLLWR